MVALIGAAVGTGLYFGNQAYATANVSATCGPGCVTDGSLYFSTDPAMRTIEDGIRTANKAARSGSYKTVVLLDPFTYSPGGTVSQARMTHELAGALLAQREVNKQAQQKDKPSVQLLLANEGTSAEAGAAQAITQIEALQKPDDITAIAGMGLSVAGTEADATVLGSDHLPMFGAVTTGDGFNSVYFPGFYQIVPDVEAQVEALLHAAPVAQDQHVALISSDQPTDIYSGDLQNDFSLALPRKVLTDYPFNPASDPAAAGKVFAEDAASVCGQPGSPTGGTKQDPQHVLYAGRAADLPPLVQVFQQSDACAGKYVTIITGSDANGLPVSATLQPTMGGIAGATVTVEYSDIEAVYRLKSPFSDYTSLVKGDVAPGTTSGACRNQTYDPWAVATYDAVMAAATAPIPPTGLGKIDGASGQFTFLKSGQLDEPTSAIPIYQVEDGHCSPFNTGSAS